MGKFTNLIEKNRAPIGQLEPADHSGQSTGVSTRFPAEEFAFNQRGWQGGTIDCHQGSVFSRTHAVDRPGQQFFSRAGFTQDEDRGVCWGNLLGQVSGSFS